MDTFSAETFSALLTQNAALLLFIIPGLVLYGYLANRTVFEGRGQVRSERFAPADVLIASFLVLMFLGFVLMQMSVPVGDPRADAAAYSAVDIIGNIAVTEIILLSIAAAPLVAMKLRGMSLRESFGFGRLGAGTLIVAAIAFLLLALPLIKISLDLSHVLLAGFGFNDAEPQEMVLFLEKNPSLLARLAVAFSALVLAPFQEELIFRGYLYGVARRYVGPAGGAVLVSLLFAAIHVHAPSFAGLFVLAMCLTLAYEWSGSLLLPMTIHALFNSITVISLLAGGSGQG